MKTKIIEATNGPQNWGKFMLGRFDSEWARGSAALTDPYSLLSRVGWTDEHLLVLDLQTGEGAIFRIFLPVYEPPPVLVEPPAPALPRGRAAARDLSGVGRILFVEDEDAVRKVAARLLKARGYEVIEAADGEEALAIAEEYAGRIDLMISDVIMPGLDGPHLLRAARPFLGDAPVMFISGYAEAEFSKVLEGETGVSFLAKPIDITVLAERVKLALQGG